MATTWNVLVVDDDEDIHTVTKLALGRLRYKDRAIILTSVYSAEAARMMIGDSHKDFHMALVDVVMESEHAGLELCDFIREQASPSLRIVLRTGQPGAAPELSVMADYDIDYYLAKADATAERLFSVVRACLRVSEDMKALEKKAQ